MKRGKGIVVGLVIAVLAGAAFLLLRRPGVQMALLERMDYPSLERSVSENPNDWRTQYWFGKRAAEAGDYVRAEPALRAAFGTRNDFLPAGTELGKVLLATGRVEEAFQVLRMVVGRDAGQTDAQIALAQLYRLQGAEHRAIEIMRELLKGDPKNKLALYELGAAHEGVDQLTDAEPPLRDCLAIDPHFGPALVVLSRVKRRTGDVAEAVRLGREAVLWSADQPGAHLELARALAASPPIGENRKAAIADLVAFLPLAPDHPGLRLELGQLLLKDGQPVVALEHLREVVRLRPYAPSGHFHLAQALAALDRRDEEKQVRARFIQLDAYDRKAADIGARIGADSENPLLRYELGELHARNGRLDRAVQAYRIGLQRDRTNEKARKRFAELIRMQQQSPQAGQPVESPP